MMTKAEQDLAVALNEWRDAAGPVEDVVAAVRRLILENLTKVLRPAGRGGPLPTEGK